MQNDKKELSIYLDDSPIVTNDFFDIHSNIAETLYEAIKRHNVKKGSLTVGLFGEWGSGKSFIIHKLKEKIKKESEDNITFLYIDVWKYSEHPLLRSILFELDKQFRELAQKDVEKKNKYSVFKEGYKDNNGKSLKDLLYYDEIFESESKLTKEEFKEALEKLWERYKVPYIILLFLFIIFLGFPFLPTEWLQNKIIKYIREFLKTIAPISGFIGIGGIFIWLLRKPFEELGRLVFFRNTVRNFTEKSNFSPEQFEEIFKDMLSKIKSEKYVIVFDNIDRCEPKIAYETLSTIKTYMDVKNCFYIIPCDDEAIKKYLSNNNLNSNEFSRQFAEEFIDKIFQTYIRIPNLKEIDRDKYIEEQLKKIDLGKELKEADINIIKEILYYAYRGETPRNIKRFINDYSSYFRLALNAYPELLEEISLFTVMIAIKQKWYKFEKIFIEYPTFFKDYSNSKDILKDYEKMENFEDFKSFLAHIEFYIKSFQEKSIDGYIYFKKSEPSIEIADKLRNGKFDIQLNDEVLKILLKQFDRNIKGKKAFALNSFITMAFLIEKYKDSSFYHSLLTEFWKCFVVSQIDHPLVIKTLYKKDILSLIINTLNDLSIAHLQSSVEDIFINCIKKPLNEEEDENKDIYIGIFEVLLKSNYEFPKKKLKTIFNDWKIEREYLNRLIEIINEQKKDDYLPNQILDKVIDEVKQNPQEAIQILGYWGHDKIPQSQGYKLVEILISRLNERNQSIKNNLQQLNQQWSQIEMDYDLLILIDDSFITDNNAEQFVSNLITLITKIFQLAPNNQNYIQKAIDFWFETAWFAETKAKEKIDEGLKNIFDKYIWNNPQRLELFSEKLRYPEQILSLKSIKAIIFAKNKELQKQFYKELDKKYFSDFELLFIDEIVQKDIEILMEVTEERKIPIDEARLIEFLLNKAINENNEISRILKYISEKFDLKKHKKIFLDHSNGIIDIYKKDPKRGYEILNILKSITSQNEFNKNFLKPLFNYLNSELEATHSIAKYINITNLIEIGGKDTEIKNLALNIVKKCLEKDQDIKENEIGLKILIKISSYLTTNQKKNLKKVILENDNYEKWDKNLRNQINKIMGESHAHS